MKTGPAVCTGLSLLLGVISSPAVAADRLTFEGLAALEYDGRIRVDELDIDQREGDFVALVEAKLRALPVDGAERSLTLGYDFSQRSHFDFPDLDRQSHRFVADGMVKVGRAELGAGLDFLHFRLGGDALLNIKGVEPSLTLPVSTRTTFSGSYRYEHWGFYDLDARDSANYLPTLTVAHRIDPGTQLTARIRHEKVNAVEPRFDLNGFLFGAAAQVPLRLLDRRGSARLDYEYRKRDYDNITPSIGERRREDRSVLTGTADLFLSDLVGLRSSIRFTDRNSNFPASNYEEIRASAGVVIRL